MTNDTFHNISSHLSNLIKVKLRRGFVGFDVANMVRSFHARMHQVGDCDYVIFLIDNGERADKTSTIECLSLGVIFNEDR